MVIMRLGGGGGGQCMTQFTTCNYNWMSSSGLGCFGQSGNPGNGGTGIVVLSYLSFFPPAITTGGIVRTVINDQQIYTYTSSGTVVFPQ